MCPNSVRGLRGKFQRSGKVRADASGFFGGGNDPLIEGAADAATLGLVVDLDEANEITSGGQPRAHGVLVRQHAVEDEGHVFVFEELGYGQHASGFRLPGAPFCFAQGRWTDQWVYRHRSGGAIRAEDFFSQGEDARPAGNYQKTVVRLAAEPTRPLQATIIHRTVETVSCQRLRYQSSKGLHLRAPGF